MRLFHLTTEACWEEIARDGEIISFLEKLLRDPASPANPYAHFSESLQDLNRRFDALVWLTSNPASSQKWQGGGPKGEVRIEVAVDDAWPWKRYARETGYPEPFLEGLASSGGNPGQWFVVERPIPSAEWVVVERPATGEILWRRERALCA